MAIAIRAKRGLTRRHLLVRSASTVALAGLGGLARPYLSRAADRPGIASGFASGDVSTDSAVVWARADRPARMRVECSTVESFRTIIGAASSDALPESDFTAKVLFEGLPPGQDIFYRVRFEDLALSGISGESQVGHFRTAPADKGSISFVWSGDTAGQGWGIDASRGGMRTYGTMLENRPDFFIHSGDHIYADRRPACAGRPHLSRDGLWAAARCLSDRHARLPGFDREQTRRSGRHFHLGGGATGLAQGGARGF